MLSSIRVGLFAALFLPSQLANANPVCAELSAAQVRADMRVLKIAEEYPGTSVALIACAGVAASNKNLINSLPLGHAH